MLLTRLPARILPPRAVMLTRNLSLIAFASEEEAYEAFLHVEPPYGIVDVTSTFGPGKIGASRLNAVQFRDRDPDDDIGPVFLGSDIAELAEELDQPSRRRLLSFLINFCRKAFELGADPDFATACRRLAQLCVSNVITLTPRAIATPHWMLVADFDFPAGPSLFVLGTDRVQRIVAHELPATALHAIGRCVDGDMIISLAEEPVLWAVSARHKMADALGVQGDPKLRAACLRALAPISQPVYARARELTFLSPATPIKHDDPRQPVGAVIDATLPTNTGHIFLRGWLRDPMRLVKSAELSSPIGSVPIALGELHRFRRNDVVARYTGSPFADASVDLGFVAYPLDPANGLSMQPTLVLHLHGGGQIAVRPPIHAVEARTARDAVLTSVPHDEITDQLLESVLGPAASAFHREALAERGAPEAIEIGPQHPNPDLSIIIPLYRNLSFLRFQLATFAADPALSVAQIIFVLDSPEQRNEVEHLLRGLYTLYALPVMLLVLSRNVGYAAANNTAASMARAPYLLLLNSDVVPASPSWTAPLIEALGQPGVAAVGPKLLFDDESLQHAGLFFRRDLDGVWFNAHYYKGLPRHWASANVQRSVPGLTGAAILLRRDRFEQIGGICEDYIIGDYEDSDLCLRLRQDGGDLIYVPESELYHFERKSIMQHDGYTGTLACRYNRWLHHHRWNDVIATLMDHPKFRFPLQSDAA